MLRASAPSKFYHCWRVTVAYLPGHNSHQLPRERCPNGRPSGSNVHVMGELPHLVNRCVWHYFWPLFFLHLSQNSDSLTIMVVSRDKLHLIVGVHNTWTQPVYYSSPTTVVADSCTPAGAARFMRQLKLGRPASDSGLSLIGFWSPYYGVYYRRHVVRPAAVSRLTF